MMQYPKFKINIHILLWQVYVHLLRQFASCVLVDVDDTLDSFFNDMAIGRYIAQRVALELMQVEYVVLIPY